MATVKRATSCHLGDWREHRCRPKSSSSPTSSITPSASASTIEVSSSMTPMALLLNLLWLFFGGVWMAVGWGIAAVVMAITIIGLPWTRAAFNIAIYAVLPFGFKAVTRRSLWAWRHRDWSTWKHRQRHRVRVGWLVAGSGPPCVRDCPCGHHHRHSIRVGALEARWNRALANRQGHRVGR